VSADRTPDTRRVVVVSDELGARPAAHTGMKSYLQQRLETYRNEPDDIEYAEAELHYTAFDTLDDFLDFCGRHGLKLTLERPDAHYAYTWVAPDGCTLHTHHAPHEPRDGHGEGYLSYTFVRGPAGAVESLTRDLVESCSYLKGHFSPLTTDGGEVLFSPHDRRLEILAESSEDDTIDVGPLFEYLDPYQRPAAYAHVPVSIPGSDAQTLRSSEYDTVVDLPDGSAYGSGVRDE